MGKKIKNDSQIESILLSHFNKKSPKLPRQGKLFAVVYTRVSSQEQAENNSSLETQLKLCKEYALRNGITIKHEFGGTYESAKTDGRKEFQQMLAYVKKDKDISYILVYNFDRFSRTGAAASTLSEQLNMDGISVKSVTQDIDSSTATGRLQENFFHLFNRYDNQQRSSRTSTNTREIMLKGYWPYHTPMGYKNLKPKHKACEHEYVITKDGKLIKQAFIWKAEGIMNDKTIIDKLSLRGLRLTEKNFRWVMSNVFYTGYVTGKLLNGQLVKGKHPTLIDITTFLKANQLLQSAPNVGICKHYKRDELPLKLFAKEEISGSPFTGYTKKGNWYYKARTKGIGVNINAGKLNTLFQNFLKNFEYKKQYS